MDDAKDRKTQIVGLTNLLRGLPDSKTSIILTIVVSMLLGLVGLSVYKGFQPSDEGIYGALSGLLIFGVPALASGWISSKITRKKSRKFLLRRSMFLSFAGMVAVGLIYTLGLLFSFGNTFIVLDALIFAYVALFAARTIIIMVANYYRTIESAAVAVVHPFLGIALLTMLSGFVSPAKLIISIIVYKSIAGLLIFVLGLGLLIRTVNAPLRKIYGVNTFRLGGAFLAHWLDGSLAIEKELKPLSEKVDAYVGLIAFKARNKMKALIVIPYLHPGPFGQVGGGKMNRIITEVTEEQLDTMTLTPHGTATHDMNPVNSETIQKIASETAKAAKNMQYVEYASPAIRIIEGRAKVLAQKIGDSAMLTSTFAPEATEDVDFTIGLTIMKKFEKDFGNVFPIDGHNTHKHGYYTIHSGSQEMFEYIAAMEKAADALKRQKTGTVRLGIAKDSMSEYGERKGFGSSGIRVAIIEVSGKKTAYLVFDGNNMEAGIREELLRHMKKMGMDEAEVMTSDTHSVNNIEGVDNPIGMRVSHDEIIRRTVELAKKADADLEDVTVATKMTIVKDVDVFGPQKATEIVAVVNTMASMLKIIAPAIMTVALLLSMLAVLQISW